MTSRRSQLGRILALVLVTLLAGCHKKVKPAPPPPPPTPAPVVQPAPLPETSAPIPEPTPEPETPPPTEPTPTTPPPPAKKPVARRPAPAPKPAPASKPTPTPETAAIGELSEGNAPDNTRLRAQTEALIADTEKRIKALPASTLQQKQSSITRVQLFLKQAKDALDSGDPEGANNLATKGKLLLDDLLK